MGEYGEPWKLVERPNPDHLECFRGDRRVNDAAGRIPIQGMEIEGHRITERVILCVNACADLTSEAIQRRSLALGRDYVM